MRFSYTHDAINLGDYGHVNYSGAFCCQGNLFADLESLSLKREYGIVRAYDCYPDDFEELYKPLYLSLPSNDDFKSLLVSFSTRLVHKYLITGVIQCLPDPRDPCAPTRHWYNVAKPFVWHRN
ncbi:hypothetical protein SCLCIDRAFT_1217348 [Scleroderma citrinum Foug A]|uniref:Uncharacterized protein n=1 Tax=Scleroderma citrinum Foug A TaxID=1036808 RepID=A0A0C3DUQ0_9AGAM|nr:hypothetical protein SCLCIDRAFT_1217348 [Scleroderma citrinum Foug A]